MTTELMQLAEAWRTAANRLDEYRERDFRNGRAEFSRAIESNYKAAAAIAAEGLHDSVARLQAQLDSEQEHLRDTMQRNVALQAQVVEMAELLHRYIAHDRAYDECNGAHMCGSNLHRTTVAALKKSGL